MAISFTTLATGALGFTLALSWNDAVVKNIASLSPPREHNRGTEARATLIYAATVTIIVMLVVFAINWGQRFLHGSSFLQKHAAGSASKGAPAGAHADLHAGIGQPPIVRL